MEIEHAHVRMLGNLVVNLWDCGGQETFMENYFNQQKESIFRGAQVLIYVLDVKSEKPEGDLEGYKECLKVSLKQIFYVADLILKVLSMKFIYIIFSRQSQIIVAKPKFLPLFTKWT